MVCACSTLTEYYLTEGNKHHGENDILDYFLQNILLVILPTKCPVPIYRAHLDMVYAICHVLNVPCWLSEPKCY